MGSVLDSLILAAALVGSFGVAFLVQKIALGIFMRVMNRR
jgi:hypothetical protein